MLVGRSRFFCVLVPPLPFSLFRVVDVCGFLSFGVVWFSFVLCYRLLVVLASAVIGLFSLFCPSFLFFLRFSFLFFLVLTPASALLLLLLSSPPLACDYRRV